MAPFAYDLARFISFRDREACERVRRIRREELTSHPDPAFHIRVIEDRAEFYRRFAEDLVGRIRLARDEGRRLVAILPVGPMPQYEIAAQMVNAERLSLAHVHCFNMDEYADEDGRTAPLSWPGSFQRAMLEHFFRHIDPDLRPPGSQIHFPTDDRIADYSARMEDLGGADVCYGGIGWGGHIAFLGAAARRRVRGRPRRLPPRRSPARRAAPDDDHAERAALVRRRLVLGTAQGQHHRAARRPWRPPPELLARR
jgi:glucosamine-6-phosphate deaminase